MTAQELWDKYIREGNETGSAYEAWGFGAAPDLLARLVANGEKTATASAYPLYEIDGEDLPQAGEYSVILDFKEEAVCIIRTSKVYITPFREVSAEHAYKEGEGDKSLKYWREVHEDVFTEWMEEAGLKFDEDMNVVCEEFEVVYPIEMKTEQMKTEEREESDENANRIETPDVFLAKPTYGDWKSIYRNLWKHVESARYMLWNPTVTKEAAKERIQKTVWNMSKNRDTYFIYEKKSGEAIGFAGMTEIEPDVYEDTGLAIGPEFVGRGYGKQVLKALIAQARGYGAKEFVCSCRNANVASARLQQSCGFAYDHSENRVDPRDETEYQIDFYRLDLRHTIREIREEEYPILEDFLYESIFIPEGMQAPPRDVIRHELLQVYIKDFGKQPDDKGFVAEVGGKIVGAVWTRKMHDYGYVDDETPSLAISLYREYRGRGIGTEMMKRMIEYLRGKGYEKTSLSCQKENYAVRMYLSVGYEIVDENEEEFIMIYRLNADTEGKLL